MRTLIAEPLTTDAFAPFGDVIDAASAKAALDINQGHTIRFDDLANIDVRESGGEVSVSIFRSTPMATPVVIRVMERHPLGSQAFVPLQGRPYLVVVAPRGTFDAGAVRAFAARGDQGVNYAKGVWHHYLLALETVSDFLVIDRRGPGENCDDVVLPLAEQFAVRFG